MCYQVFNSTLSIVKTEVDQFLKDYSLDHPYRQALSFPYFRHKLIAKVLNNIPNNHILIDEFDYFIDDVSFCIGSLDEKLLIIGKIKEQIPYIIQEFNQFNYTYKSGSNYQHKFIEKSNSNAKKLSWWIRVDTTKPPMTYYFGPFDNLFDAKDNCGGYLEDLVAEKAEGIYFEFQYVNPPSLTIENYPEYLRLENQKILANISQLSLQKDYYENLFLSSYDSCLIIDDNAIIQEVNNSMIKLLKTPKENLINQSLNLFIHPDYLLKFCAFIHQLKDKNIEQKQSCFLSKLLLSDKSSIIVKINAVKISNNRDKIIRWYLSIQDITEIEQKNQELFYQSRYDSLTNLPNRRSLLEFLQNTVNQVHNNRDHQFGVLFLDIDKFKQINDTFGHLIGDDVLINFSKRLITCVRNGDQVARYSGDEFMIVLSNIHSPQEAEHCAYRIQKSLSNCFHIQDNKIMLSVSIGIVIGSFENSNLFNILSNADIAMYQAKSKGELFSIYQY